MVKRKRPSTPALESTEVGSHFLKVRTVLNDEWQTALDSWKNISTLFNGYKTAHVWQPFYYDGECAKHMATLGFQRVTHEFGVDFFNKVQDEDFIKSVDIIIDNPPYTGKDMKVKVLRALEATGKPFVMLFPSSILFSEAMRDTLDPDFTQVIVPRKVQVRKTGQDTVPFKYLVWLCYKTSLPRDLMFID